MNRRHDFHFRQFSRPVLLLREIDFDAETVVAERTNDADASRRHVAPLEFRRANRRPDSHSRAHLKKPHVRISSLGAALSPYSNLAVGLDFVRRFSWKAFQFNMPVAHPIGPRSASPNALHIQIIQAVAINLENTSHHLLYRTLNQAISP